MSDSHFEKMKVESIAPIKFLNSFEILKVFTLRTKESFHFRMSLSSEKRFRCSLVM